MTEKEDKFDQAFDAGSDRDLKLFLLDQLKQHGHGGIEETAAEKAERERVEDLIARDKAYRQREKEREAALLKVSEGNYVDLAGTVVEPTPEWMEKGDTRTFIPKQPKDTTKIAKSVRRVVTPMVIRMLHSGRITEKHAQACIWYRAQYDEAGLSGRVKTSHISLTGNTGGSGGMGQAPMALHHREAEARAAFRAAREAIAPVLLKMFDSVVIHDIPLRSAKRFIRCRNGQESQRFMAACEDLMLHLEKVGIEVTGDADSHGD